jgi:hypothetical protein
LYGECYYQDYERIEGWLRTFDRERPYCFVAGEVGACAPTTASLVAFVVYSIAARNIGVLAFFLLLALPVALMFANVMQQRSLVVALRPRLLSVVLALVAGVLLCLAKLGAGLWGSLFLIDALFLAALAYVSFSLLLHIVTILRNPVGGNEAV